MNPIRPPIKASHHADVITLLVLVSTTIFSSRDLLFDPVRAGLDTITFFWPTYAFLGDQLKSGNIPGWNPYQFSGVPFLADPESGWWYLPAMVAFGILPFAIAIKVYATIHILIAGLGTYAYGRVIGMAPAGALIAAWAVSQGGLFTNRSRCCYTHIQVAAWIPIALLAVELAIHATRARPKVAAWSLGGFAISQMLAGWIGQGAMYGLLLAGAYVAFRTLLSPAIGGRAWRLRVRDAAAHGLLPLLLGIGLAAPGALPRLRYYQITNLADGYTGSASWAAQFGGWTFGRQLEQLMSPSGWFLGSGVLGLAIIGLIVAWKRSVARFFGALSCVAFILGLERHTFVHQLLFALVPGFEKIHTHIPERIALILVFGPAILAGLGFSELERRMQTRGLTLALTVVAVAAVGMRAAGLSPGPEAWTVTTILISLVAFLALSAWRKMAMTYRIVSVMLALLVIVNLQILANASFDKGEYVRVESRSIAQRNETANFLHDPDGIPPSRFFGYDPALSVEQHGEITYYRNNFKDRMTSELLVNNRGTLWGLADIQGYNPLQIQRYVEFVTAVNGAPQEYHGSYVLPGGIASPLLPLLAPEYIVIPKDIPPGRTDLQYLISTFPEVASTDRVRVLRFTDALPRAWIVHQVVEAERSDVPALLTQSGTDFRDSAILESDVPPMERPTGRVQERADITTYEPAAISLDVTSDGSGMLILSEMYADGWSAQVDGASADVVPADGILRGIPIPDGSHTVTLTYEPPGLDQGFAIFASTLLAVAAAWIVAVRLDRRTTRYPATSTGPRDSARADRRA